MKENGIEAHLDSGGKVGEFTVWVDDDLVIRKRFIRFPDKEEILQSVKEKI